MTQWRLWCGIFFVLGTTVALVPQVQRTHGPPAAAIVSVASSAPPMMSRPLPPLKRHPSVALTFDDLPAAGGLRPGVTRVEIITQLIQVLRKHHIKGVYGFVNAIDLGDDPDTQQALRLWIDAGMNLGSHTWSHSALSNETAEAFEDDIAHNELALNQYAGKRDWHWFRYPYLEEGDTLTKRNHVRAWLHRHGYRIAEVTLNFNDDDWSDPYIRCMAQHDQAAIEWLQQSYLESAAQLIPPERKEEQLAFGHEIPNVLLLHATEFTTLMLPRLLELLKQQGFRFTSLSKAESNRAYASDPAIGLPEGGQFSDEVLAAHHIRPPAMTPEPTQRLNSICR